MGREDNRESMGFGKPREEAAWGVGRALQLCRTQPMVLQVED